MVKDLAEKGHQVLTYDNLSKGHREAVLFGEFVLGDIGDRERLREVIRGFRPHVVMHFAAFIEVAESVKNPSRYYENNAVRSIRMLEVLVEENVRNIIFSSTAAVYGVPERIPIPEEHPLNPINPYGWSKLVVEKAIEDFSRAYGLRYAILRYFNAAGADPLGRIGESHEPETHLIPLVLMAASGRRSHITIYGTDYPTPDGTAIRDYIHVEDLSHLHILAMDYIMEAEDNLVINCGYGRGYSVREVIEVARKVTGRDFRVEEGDRRPGDIPHLVADNSRIKRIFDWKPEFDDLEKIIATAWHWELHRKY